MKRVGVFFLIILFTYLVLGGNFTVKNMSIGESYPMNQILTGEINITINNLDSDTLFKMSNNQSATLLKLLEENSAIYTCIPSDCSTGYKVVRGGSTLSLPLNIGQTKTFGFYVNGSRIDYPELSFLISSNFKESLTPPLKITFLESNGSYWNFDSFSGTATRASHYGYYNGGYAEVDSGIIGETIFCSEIYISETDKLQVGADVALNGGTGELVFKMYNDVGMPYFENEEGLSFDPSKNMNGVVFRSSEEYPFSAGNYYFCLESKDKNSTYKLFIDKSSGYYSSFSYRGDSFNSSAATGEKTKTYSIFVAEAIYADSISLPNVNFSSYLENADSYLESKYFNDCSFGCYFPFEAYSSVSQNLTISNTSISYWLDRESDRVNNNIYLLEKVPAKISFSGNLDLSVLDFKMNKSGTYKFYIGKNGSFEKIYTQSVDITSAPIILGVYPGYIPAGINAKLFAELDYDGDPDSLTYDWDFGDSSTQTTNTNSVLHLYNNISKFNVKVTVKDGNLSNFYEREITTISPKVYVNLIYEQLSISLNDSVDTISTFPSWIQPILEKSLNVMNTQDELKVIKRDIDKAVSDGDYLKIAQKINNLDLPRQVFISEDYTSDLPLTESVNLDGLVEYTSEELESEKDEEYQNAVSLWQDEYLEYSIKVQKISLMRTSGAVEDILKTYVITVNEVDPIFEDEYFLVLDTPRDQINLKSSTNKEPKSYGGTTIFPIESGSLTLEFYVLGNTDVDFFSTPAIKDLTLNVDINEDCNFNYICEDGETYKTCRSDCKPVGLMIFYIFLAFILMLVVYTFIQVWYLKYYENTLFKKDKNRLYNLLMFVTAAQTNGMSREEIKTALREKGWTVERIDYVLKKVNGERIGLYEIIPLSKIMANSRKKQIVANKGFPLQRSVPGGGDPLSFQGLRQPMPGSKVSQNNLDTPFSRQQNGRNINKESNQGNNNRK